jgi:hypothetical protein
MCHHGDGGESVASGVSALDDAGRFRPERKGTRVSSMLSDAVEMYNHVQSVQSSYNLYKVHLAKVPWMGQPRRTTGLERLGGDTWAALRAGLRGALRAGLRTALSVGPPNHATRRAAGPPGRATHWAAGPRNASGRGPRRTPDQLQRPRSRPTGPSDQRTDDAETYCSAI